MTDFELLGLYYQLGDGIHWNAQEKKVAFASQESAVAFYRAAPNWRVAYGNASLLY